MGNLFSHLAHSGWEYTRSLADMSHLVSAPMAKPEPVSQPLIREHSALVGTRSVDSTHVLLAP